MNTIIDNWWLLVIIACMVSLIVEVVIHFIQEPTDKKIANVKEWLLYAVIEAEKVYGSKTGTLKLRYVYGLAIEKFPWVANIPFEVFSSWVDTSLEWMKVQLQSNKTLKDYVEGE